MNTNQLSTAEMSTAVSEGVRQGLVHCLSQGYREPRELIFDALRLGLSDAITKIFEGYSVEDVLDVLKTAVRDRR